VADLGLVTNRPATAPLPVLLASASPARLATLRRAGLDPAVQVSDVDEDALIAAAPAATPAQLVALLARAKADAVVRRRRADPDRPVRELVIGCDSMLELDGSAQGKPGDPLIAAARWRAMRGRTGVLHTGHAIAVMSADDPDGARWAEAVSSTRVRFADLTDAEIDAYIGTGEPLGVAGGFTIDGLGGWFVESLTGDHHGVVGISLPLLLQLLGTLGIAVMDLWPPATPIAPNS